MSDQNYYEAPDGRRQCLVTSHKTGCKCFEVSPPSVSEETSAPQKLEDMNDYCDECPDNGACLKVGICRATVPPPESGPSLPSEGTRQILSQLKEIECASYPEARKLNALIDKLGVASPAEGPTYDALVKKYNEAYVEIEAALGIPPAAYELIELVRMAAKRLVEGPKPGPRCPKCEDGRLVIIWASHTAKCQNCDTRFDHLMSVSDFAQFFTPSARDRGEDAAEVKGD